MKTYEIFEDNMERLSKKLKTIENKCSKYGCGFVFREVGETFKEVEEENGNKRTVRFVQVEVEGVAKVGNWEFVATLEHGDDLNVVRSFRTDVKVPAAYHKATPYCEHCNTKRYRKDTYLIRNTETGEFKQVGKTCLKDFTNGLSAELVTAYISYFDELIKGEQPSESSRNYYLVKEVLQYAVESVRLYGYVKTYSDGMSTKEVVQEQLFQLRGWDDRRTEDGYNPEHRGNEEKVADILNWAKGLTEVEGYELNLKAICSRAYCESRDFGLICSAVAAYARHEKALEKKAADKQAASVSNWVGSEGDKIELKDASLSLLTSWDSEWGYVYLYKLTDKSGNIFTWKTGKWLGNMSNDLPQTISLKGTVKAHTEFRGIAQTELTRCRVA